MIQSLVSYLGNAAIRKKWDRNKAVVVPASWENVKSIGILYDATNPACTQAITILQNQLVTENKKVNILAFINTNKKELVPADKLDVTYISKKDISFNKIPKESVIEKFIEKPFDYLIDLNIQEHIPLHYISVNSLAKMKVGKAYSKNNHLNFNILINKTDDLANDIQQLINNLYHYLTQLKNSKND